MIHKLRLRNFKGIREAELGLERLTVIVGPNASGKTSFLEALSYATRLRHPSVKSYFHGRRDPTLLFRRDAFAAEMELAFSTSEGNIRLRVLPPDDFFTFQHHRWQVPTIEEWNFVIEVQPQDAMDTWLESRELPIWEKMVSPAILLQLNPTRMANPSDSAKIEMSSDGSGLASVLAFMALNQPGNFQSVQRLLKTIVPSLESIRFIQKPIKTKNQEIHSGYQLLFDFQNTHDIPSYAVSEGTMLVLGLLTVLMSYKRPNLILLDDLDRGLHPKAQREVVGLLRQVLDLSPDLQIVATTHSPYLVDCLRPEEVRLTTLGEDGTVSIAGLVDHPDFDKWKDEMAPGEMWSLFGEKWVSEVHKVAGGE